MARWRLLDIFVNPLVELFYPLPKSALIPVTVLWLGFGDGSKILLIFLGCMIPVTIGAYNGARGSDHALVWSARSMGANRLRMMWDVVVPSALPELLNGIRTALALAFILLVSSELIVSQQGFGYLIGYLGSTGSYEGMYAVVLTVAFLGFAADRHLSALHPMAAAMAGVDDTASLAAPKPGFPGCGAASRYRFPQRRRHFLDLVLLIAWECLPAAARSRAFMLPPFSAVARAHLRRRHRAANSGTISA